MPLIAMSRKIAVPRNKTLRTALFVPSRSCATRGQTKLNHERAIPLSLQLHLVD